MKIISRIAKIIPIFLLVLGLQSCSDDDDNTPVVPSQNIVEIAASTPDLSSLVAALGAADGDLISVLNGNGPFTVLAPTNAAFQALLDSNPAWNTIEDIDSAVLSQVLLNHVIGGTLTSSTLTSNGSGYTSTSADGAGGANLSIYYNTSSGVRFNNVSSVTADGADISASNGVIHIVDAVIGLPNLVDHATANPDLSDLVAALTAGGSTTFTDLLSTPGDFTVFAPNNTAFGAFTNPNGNDIANVLSNHVIAGATALSNGLTNSYLNTAAVNADDDVLSIYINTDNGVALNGTSNVMQADVVATNGVIHIVDEVIDLPTVVTFAAADPTFSSLVASLTEADGSAADPMLIPTLSGAGPFTVFAPTNDAFQALLDSNAAWDSPADIDDDLLNSVLTHHVIAAANVRAEDLTDGIMPTTFEGDMITINLPGNDGNPAKITDGAGNADIDIIVVDVQANNGVIHAVETVLIPDTTN